jgi:hypothetical protein
MPCWGARDCKSIANQLQISVPRQRSQTGDALANRNEPFDCISQHRRSAADCLVEKINPDAALFGPFHHGCADIFRTVVASDCHRCTAPFDDLIQMI